MVSTVENILVKYRLLKLIPLIKKTTLDNLLSHHCNMPGKLIKEESETFYTILTKL